MTITNTGDNTQHLDSTLQAPKKTVLEIVGQAGVIKFPNGSSYTIKNLMVGGKNYTNLSELSPHQRVAIEGLMHKAFMELTKGQQNGNLEMSEMKITHNPQEELGKQSKVVSKVGQQQIEKYVDLKNEYIGMTKAFTGPEPIHEHKDMGVTLNTVNNVSQRVFNELGKGKAKIVLETDQDKAHVYYIAVKGGGYTYVKQGLFYKLVYVTKEQEIREEVATAKEIKAAFIQKFGQLPEESNIAYNLEEVTKEGEKVPGEYTVKTKKASGDMEKELRKKPPGFPASAAIGLKVLNGMNNLNKAGFGHGDLKSENILISPDETGNIKDVWVSDFGKTRKLDPKKPSLYSGNLRHAPPEGPKLTQKGEIFGTGVMLTRLLESQFLSPTKRMLVKPTRYDPSEDVKESGKEIHKSEGFELFLVTNRDCPQTSKMKHKIAYYVRGILKAIGIPVKTPNLKTMDTETAKYYDALKAELKPSANGDTSKEKAIDDLCNLLMSMTRTNPEGRPESMQKALDEYTRCMSIIQPKEKELETL